MSLDTFEATIPAQDGDLQGIEWVQSAGKANWRRGQADGKTRSG